MTVEMLKQKIEELVNKHQIALDENVKLKSLNDQLLEEINEKNDKLTDLKENDKVLRISEVLKTKNGSKETNLKINELVREIDKCIAQLNI